MLWREPTDIFTAFLLHLYRRFVFRTQRLQKLRTAEKEAMERLQSSRAMSVAKSRQSVLIKPNFSNTLEREPYQ